MDRTDKLKENRETIKNISDWTIQNITIQGYTVLVSVDEDNLLRAASLTSARHAVVLSTGTEFINGYSWFETLENYCQEDFFIAGHILDRKEFYYELHEQCYIVNLNTYKNIGSPNVGAVSFFENHLKIKPMRSRENIHDDYTPVWVKTGSEFVEYKHKAHGWNILTAAFKNNLTVKVLDGDLRASKIHYYPEYPSYQEQISFAYARESFCNGMAIYLNNSERVVPANVQGPIQQLVVPASGLNWLQYLAQGFDSRTRVKFYDYSFLTLEYIKEVVENWNGVNYQEFALNYFNSKFNFIGGGIPFCGSSDFETIDTELWQQIKSTVTFEYHWLDLLNTQADISWIENKPNTVVNLTNAFNYIGTAAVRSVKDRIYCENSFIQRLQRHAPTAQVILTRRAADGFANTVKNVSVAAIDLTPTDIRTLTKPTWHSHDWSN